LVDLSPFHGYTDNDSCCATNAPASTIFRRRQEERGEYRYTRSGSTHTSGNCTPHTHTSNHSSFSCGVKLRNIPIRLFTIQHLHWTGKQSPAFQCLIFRISPYVLTHTVVTRFHFALSRPSRPDFVQGRKPRILSHIIFRNSFAYSYLHMIGLDDDTIPSRDRLQTASGVVSDPSSLARLPQHDTVLISETVAFLLWYVQTAWVPRTCLRSVSTVSIDSAPSCPPLSPDWERLELEKFRLSTRSGSYCAQKYRVSLVSLSLNQPLGRRSRPCKTGSRSALNVSSHRSIYVLATAWRLSK